MEIQQVNLGQVAFNPKGSWNADATYKRLNVVYYKGRSYYAKQDNTNQPPSMQSEYWGLMVDGGDVTNNPDEEDVTSMMDEDGKSVIKFADRAYDPDRFSGKGYKILRKNMQNVRLAVVTINVTKAPTADGELSVTINNIDTHITLSATDHNTTALTAQAIADALTPEHEDYDIEVSDSTVKLTRKFGEDVPASAYDVAATGMELTVEDTVKTVRRNIITQVMISKPNTIYEIRYDFDLNGGEIEVPEGCTLKFEGGMLRNGTVNIKETIVYGIDSFNIDIKLKGSIFGGYILSSIVRTRNLDEVIQVVDGICRGSIKSANEPFITTLYLDRDLYYVNKSVDIRNIKIKGRGQYRTLIYLMNGNLHSTTHFANMLRDLHLFIHVKNPTKIAIDIKDREKGDTIMRGCCDINNIRIDTIDDSYLSDNVTRTPNYIGPLLPGSVGLSLNCSSGLYPVDIHNIKTVRMETGLKIFCEKEDGNTYKGFASAVNVSNIYIQKACVGLDLQAVWGHYTNLYIVLDDEYVKKNGYNVALLLNKVSYSNFINVCTFDDSANSLVYFMYVINSTNCYFLFASAEGTYYLDDNSNVSNNVIKGSSDIEVKGSFARHFGFLDTNAKKNLFFAEIKNITTNWSGSNIKLIEGTPILMLSTRSGYRDRIEFNLDYLLHSNTETFTIVFRYKALEENFPYTKASRLGITVLYTYNDETSSYSNYDFHVADTRFMEAIVPVRTYNVKELNLRIIFQNDDNVVLIDTTSFCYFRGLVKGLCQSNKSKNFKLIPQKDTNINVFFNLYKTVEEYKLINIDATLFNNERCLLTFYHNEPISEYFAYINLSSLFNGIIEKRINEIGIKYIHSIHCFNKSFDAFCKNNIKKDDNGIVYVDNTDCVSDFAILQNTLVDYNNPQKCIFFNTIQIDEPFNDNRMLLNYGDNIARNDSNIIFFDIKNRQLNIKQNKNLYKVPIDSPIIKTEGTSLQRPVDVTVGFLFFDTSLSKPIFYKGDNIWVDAAGTEV